MLFALNENAEVIDKFNGLADLDNRVLRAVGKAEERFNEMPFASCVGYVLQRA